MQTILIDRNINDAPQDFDYLFQIYKQIYQLQNSEITFNLSGCNFMRQNAVVFLGAFIRLLQKQNNRVGLVTSSLSKPLHEHLDRNGFMKEFGLVSAQKFSSTAIPYRRDFPPMPDHQSYTTYLAKDWLGRGWIDVSPDVRDTIISHLIEAYINVFDHAQSPIGVITCGQFFPKLRELKLSLIDLGVGIPHNVRAFKKNRNISDSEALRWAFEDGATTKPNTIARGNGLKVLKEFICTHDGRLEIYSQQGYVCIQQNGDVYQNRPIGFRGTFVQVSLKCDVNLYSFTQLDSDTFF